MTPEQIASVAGVVVSLVFSYAPALKDWYDALTPTPKRLVMLGVLLVVTAGLLAYQCRGDGACYAANWQTYVSALIAAVIANQATMLLTPLSPERRLVRQKAFEAHMAAKSVNPVP